MKFFALLLIYVNLSIGLSLKDSLGKTIEIPNKIERIAVVGGMWPLPSIIILLDSKTNRLSQIPKASLNALKESVLYDFYPEILKIHSGNTENIEEILKLNPDLAFCHQANRKLCDSLNKIGIPTITLSVNIDNYNYKLTLKNWLEIIGKVLDKENLAQKIIDKNEKVQMSIQNKLKVAKQKPKALILHRYTENEIVADGLFANYLLEASGAQNIFPNFVGSKKVSLEEIYSLNPDIIYITNFTSAMPQDLLNSKLWEGINAIKNKHVYKIPLGTYRWFAPSAEFSIFLMWLSKHNHPEIFSSINIEKELKEHFKEFYNIDLKETQMQKILHPSRKAGILR
ncbi:hypothetical protein BKH41_09025 [Helicobacter sp. 12S02232-10]|uniref:ABC transporter substrate-binding protein n=1 Tax=Helicobacter sp. 12S02232-10 TaxID=1476197 RepID=UPI000BD6DE03|nr:ABC transporter substrate-binding protein [Helicobacter sp. 12S02232-10]PAF46477.1 hypothetical protein BKH41_09025 [Helicobacter sp. 12S02232-10]